MIENKVEKSGLIQLDLNDFVELDFPIWTIDYTMYYIVFGIIILLAISICNSI